MLIYDNYVCVKTKWEVNKVLLKKTSRLEKSLKEPIELI